MYGIPLVLVMVCSYALRPEARKNGVRLVTAANLNPFLQLLHASGKTLRRVIITPRRRRRRRLRRTRRDFRRNLLLRFRLQIRSVRNSEN